MAILEARNVTREYRMKAETVRALAEVSVAVERGDFVAILGTSGSGKSTLLNLFGGLDRPTSGEILFDGQSLEPLSSWDMSRYRLRRVGMRSLELLDRVGLLKRADHLPSELSGGEQQRVSIARAIANEPQVLLADEPTGNLDSSRAAEVMGVLDEMRLRDDKTIVLVTHDRELADRFATRVIRLKDGKVITG
jgi:putative ABC transport system ATP-binding protein